MPETNEKYVIDPTGQKKVILSIDGGGMRGAITLAMLAELEKQSGKTCQEMFDMFVGTSTGSIIAAGLAVGYTATQLQDELKLYRKLLPEAFNADQSQFWWIQGAFSIAFIQFGKLSPNQIIAMLIELFLIVLRLIAFFVLTVALLGVFLINLVIQDPMLSFVGRIMAHGLRYAYPLQPFFDKLNPFIDARGIISLADIKDKILLTTTKNLETGETVFVTNAGKGAIHIKKDPNTGQEDIKQRFSDWTIVDAVAGSSAAPIFFNAYRDRFVDGGVSPYGNPCFIAAVEAMEYIGDYTRKNRAVLEEAKIDANILNLSEQFDKNKVILVSIGTGYPPDDIKSKTEVANKIFFDWMHYIISESLDDAVNQQVWITRKLYGAVEEEKNDGDIDFRRYNISLRRDEIAKLNLTIPDNIKPEQLSLDSSKLADVEFMAAIGQAYARAIDWRKPNKMPWSFDGGQPDPEDQKTDNRDW